MTPTSYFFTLHVFTSLEHYLFGRLACYSTRSFEVQMQWVERLIRQLSIPGKGAAFSRFTGRGSVFV